VLRCESLQSGQASVDEMVQYCIGLLRMGMKARGGTGGLEGGGEGSLWVGVSVEWGATCWRGGGACSIKEH
jgi:hypothetical protein